MEDYYDIFFYYITKCYYIVRWNSYSPTIIQKPAWLTIKLLIYLFKEINIGWLYFDIILYLACLFFWLQAFFFN